jgi:hypothetical protein
VVFEEIYGFPGDHEPVRESNRGLPLHPAKATLAALTAWRFRADAAFASLVGSVTFVPGDPERYFEAMGSGASERKDGTASLMARKMEHRRAALDATPRSFGWSRRISSSASRKAARVWESLPPLRFQGIPRLL